MSKFNQTRNARAATSPVQSKRKAAATTHQGGQAYMRDAKGELFTLAVSNMVSEKTFYEDSIDRDSRYRDLIHTVAYCDPDWTRRFLKWLRTEANMRSASLVGGLEAARALNQAELPGGRQIVDAVMVRADEPGEALAYWTARYGRRIPKSVKRGIADAVLRLYRQRSFLKWDSAKSQFRFADVLQLVHPSTSDAAQDALFSHILDERYGNGNDIPNQLGMLRSNQFLRHLTIEDPAVLFNSSALSKAGMTWEDVLSLAGDKLDKRKLWEAVIPSMGYMALLRNLRNFDQAGVSDEVAETVTAKLTDPEEVKRSRQFPFRFLAAYQAAPSLRWSYPLEKALGSSLANVPELPGRTLIMVDRSMSMRAPMSDRSDLTAGDSAAIFGTALALRAERPTLVQFGSSSQEIDVKPGTSVLRVMDSYEWLGGTDTAGAIRKHYSGHDRVVIVTDEQANYWGGDPARYVPDNVPVYTWNLVGYRYGHAPSGENNRHTFAGLTDKAFSMIPLLEHKAGEWPF